MSIPTGSATTTRRPLISFVMTGRNDGFMGDFNWRLATSINVMARGAARLGRLNDIEVVVSDWNSDVPLHKVVELVPEARAIARFVPVPKSIAVQVQKDTHFPDSIVVNTAIRRASGDFICPTGSDVVFTPACLNSLLCLLEGKYADLPLKNAFMTGGRRHIPNGIINRRLPLQEFENYLSRNAAYFPEERGGPGHLAPTNMMLMHRDLWQSSRAFDERFIYWGFNDIDITLRLSAQHDFIQLEHFGVNSLHMEHWSKPRDYSPEKMFRKLNPVDNLVPEFAPNSQDWGLGQFDIPLAQCEAPEPDVAATETPDETPWFGPLENLGREIGKPEVQNAVRDVLTQFAHLPIPASEHPALMALVWCAAIRRPRSFVEIGFRYPHAAAMVARSAPGTELQAVVDFERRPEDDQLFYSKEETSLIFFLTHALRQNGHWPYTHYIQRKQSVNGQVQIKSPGLTGPLDLVFIRAKDETAIQAASEVAPILRKLSAVIITASNPSLYQKTVEALLQTRPGVSVISFADGVNGLILVTA